MNENKIKTIEEVRKEILEKVSNATPEVLQIVWNKTFGETGNYLSYSYDDNKIFSVEQEDWSDPFWDE